MNKTELVKKISAEEGFTQKDVLSVVESVFETIKSEVAKGEQVSISGFGKFSVSERAERIGRNPSTGESITIPASNIPKFKVGAAFKDAVNA